MKSLLKLFQIELTLAVREFSGVLFGLIMPVGIIILIGALNGKEPAFEGASFSSIQQSLAAVMTVGICATGLMGIPLSISAYREKKVLKRFQVTPTSPGLLLAAQFFSNLVFALISSLLVWLVAAFFFDYRLIGSLGWLILCYTLVVMAIYSLGMFIASVSSSVRTASLLCSLLYFPMLVLSGATIPYEIMPKGMRLLADVFPLTQGIKLLKAVSLNQQDFRWQTPVLVLVLTFLVGTIGAVKTFRWE